MSGTTFKAEQDERIRKACGYMTSNLSIAQIFMVSESYVAGIRARLPRFQPQVVECVSGVHDSTYHLDVQMRRSEAAKACAAHLRALIDYGFKHNSDLGMGRDAFLARAKEIGVVA